MNKVTLNVGYRREMAKSLSTNLNKNKKSKIQKYKAMLQFLMYFFISLELHVYPSSIHVSLHRFAGLCSSHCHDIVS